MEQLFIYKKKKMIDCSNDLAIYDMERILLLKGRFPPPTPKLA